MLEKVFPLQVSDTAISHPVLRELGGTRVLLGLHPRVYSFSETFPCALGKKEKGTSPANIFLIQKSLLIPQKSRNVPRYPLPSGTCPAWRKTK